MGLIWGNMHGMLLSTVVKRDVSAVGATNPTTSGRPY
jgi:hypothetical protein